MNYLKSDAFVHIFPSFVSDKSQSWIIWKSDAFVHIFPIFCIYIFSISSCSHHTSLSEPEYVFITQVRTIYHYIESEGKSNDIHQDSVKIQRWLLTSARSRIKHEDNSTHLVWLNINIKPPIYRLYISSNALQCWSPALVNLCQLACIHQFLSDSIWGVAVQYGGPRVLAGVTGDVVRGSQVNLVHLACACSAGIGFGSIGPCRGCSLYKGCFNLL